MTFSTRTMQPADWLQSTYFNATEFTAPEKMGVEFIQWLNEVRKLADVPMRITSSYRSPAHNARVGGASGSSHSDTPCNAVDIGRMPSPSDPNWNHGRFRIIQAALELGCTRIGIYPNGSVHLDRTEDQRPDERLWVTVDNPARG
jgi:zinc D-Ala-D-Ala carboxypeptidase